MHLRLMRSEDLTFCDELRALVGWNQRRQDWERFLRLSPNGCFIAEVNGRAVGTVTTIHYGTRVGWVGMLLVRPDCRGKGVGKGLLERAIAFLRDQKVECVKLDATPQGEPIYARMGFVKEFQITRWEASRLQQEENAGEYGIRKLEETESIVSLDERAFGVPRPEFLRQLFHDSASALVCSEAGEIRGFGMLRDGSRASYLGPIIAENRQAALKLIHRLLQTVSAQSVFWDLPEATASDEIPKRIGFQVQRQLSRMRLGPEVSVSHPDWYWGLADPSCG